MYRSGVSNPYDVPTIVELAIAHNQHCDLVRFGKLAKQLCENPPLDRDPDNYAAVFNKGVQAFRDMLTLNKE